MTGKKFEIVVTIVLGFDTEAEAVANAEAFRCATTAIATEGGHPGLVRAQLRERRAIDATPEPKRAVDPRTN